MRPRTQCPPSICDHPDIQAISFVGSTKVAKIVYKRATQNLKRCLALGGAKNHLLVLPDAIPDMTAQNITASMSGCAGQRCMAASAMIAVGDVDHIIDKLCTEAKKMVAGQNLGAVINKESRERIESYIDEAEKMGAKILVDGRNTVVNGKEKGTYIGVTIISTRSDEIRLAIIENLGRGCTIYNGKRGFGKRGDRLQPTDIIFTAITRLELSKLRLEIEKIDDDAFVVMHAIKDTKGGMIKKRPLAH